MKVITYPPSPSLADQIANLERRYGLQMLDEAIELLKAQRAKLTSADQAVSAEAADQAAIPEAHHMPDYCDVPKKRGRPRKEKRSLEQIMQENPKVAALTEALHKLHGSSQDTSQRNPKVMTAGASEKRA